MKQEKKRAKYNERIKSYIEQLDKPAIKQAIHFAKHIAKHNSSIVFQQKLKMDGFDGLVEIHIALRGNMWEHNVYYNGRFLDEVQQALLFVRDEIYVDQGLCSKEYFEKRWGFLL